MITDVTGVLLAGGKSRRMGEDKRFLSVGEGTLYERSLAVLRSVFQTVFVVIAQDSPALQSDVPVFRDLIADCGSLGGLYTGLKQAATPYVFAVACDMPFLDPAMVRYFTEMKDKADVVMAELQNGLQPMHALSSMQATRSGPGSPRDVSSGGAARSSNCASAFSVAVPPGGQRSMSASPLAMASAYGRQPM